MMFPKPVKATKTRNGMKRHQMRQKPPQAKGKAARLHLLRVKLLPCCICGASGPSDAHHVFHDRYSQAKASDFAVIPLCKTCHQVGPHAIHNDKNGWKDTHGPDHSYIPQTLEVAGIDTSKDF